MGLKLGKLLADDLILDQSAPQSIIKFKNNERCLMSLFWTCYNNLEEGRNTLLVIDNQEDLEKINYHISKNGLSYLALIFNNVTAIDSQYWKEKFRDDDQRKRTLLSQAKEHDLAESSLEELISEINLNATKLRIPQLGSMSLAKINDKLVLGGYRPIDTSAQILKPPYDYGIYRAKKEMFIEAENLYNEKYAYIKDQDPFLKESILEIGREEIQIKLTDALSEVKALLKRYDDIEAKVTSSYEDGSNGGLDKIKKELSYLKSMFFGQAELSETEITKQIYQQANLFETLNITADAPKEYSELKMGLARIEEAVGEQIVLQYSKTQILSEAYLSKLTAANIDFPEVKDLIADTNLLAEEVRRLEIFKEDVDQQSVAFSFQKENLKRLHKKLAYAQYFLAENEGYIEWLNFEQQLSQEDQLIINYLSHQDQFWGEGFESLFLAYYVNHSKSNLNSVQQENEQLANLLADFTKLRHIGLVRNNFTYEGELLDIESENWESFFDKSSVQIMERYPLLIIDSSFYQKYGDRLINAVDNIIFHNQIPKKIYEEEWLENTFVGYDPAYLELAKHALYALPNNEQKEVTLKSYNVNRHFKNLSISEMNRAARYLGQQMQSASLNYNIYQTKGTSLISFWSDAKNAILLRELEENGVKEIVSDSPDFNLMPGILADLTTQNIVLLEDNLFSVDGKQSIVQQHMLIDQLRTAGITVLSIDNYLQITRGKEGLSKVISNLKLASKTKAALVV